VEAGRPPPDGAIHEGQRRGVAQPGQHARDPGRSAGRDRRSWRGFVLVAFVIDAFARRIVGWRVSASLATDFVLDALEQGIYNRCGLTTNGLIHHSDRGKHLSMRYTDRLAEAGIAPSVGSRGDSYDNALAESIIGRFKTEVIQRKGPWRHLEAVEFATLDWVDWFNHRRLLEPIGYLPPAEYEARYHEQPRRLRSYVDFNSPPSRLPPRSGSHRRRHE
jgi:putative transposase